MLFFVQFLEGQSFPLSWINCIRERSKCGLPMIFYLNMKKKISSIFSKETADLILGVFTLLPNVKRAEIHYNLGLIGTDLDDNKFVDCAFAGNVHYLVTNDRHFNKLKTLEFPTINVITLEEFRELV